jgi:hypothetical protein
MVEPLKFRSRVAELAGGHDAILATARDMLTKTDRVTKAADASKIPESTVRAHVVGVVFKSLKNRLREPLIELLDTHIQAVSEEYMLFEGEPPDDAHAAIRWRAGLTAAVIESFTGEVENSMMADKLRGLIQQDCSVIALTDAILAPPIVDIERAMGALKITTEDLDALMAEVRAPPKPAFTLKDLAALVRARLEEGADLLEMSENVQLILAQHGGAQGVMNVVAPDPELQRKLMAFLDNRPPVTDNLDAECVMMLATQEVGAISAEKPQEAPRPAAPKRAPSGPRKAAQAPPQLASAAPEAVAARGALEAICAYSSVTEAALSNELGVSRAQMNNYRHGRTAWHPSPAQRASLEKFLQDNIAGLGEALTALMEV